MEAVRLIISSQQRNLCTEKRLNGIIELFELKGIGSKNGEAGNLDIGPEDTADLVDL